MRWLNEQVAWLRETRAGLQSQLEVHAAEAEHERMLAADAARSAQGVIDELSATLR